MKDVYIGLMSGTSLDAIDAVLVDFSYYPPQLLGSHTLPLTPELKDNLRNLSIENTITIKQLAQLDREIAKLSVTTIKALLDKTPFPKKDIKGIGSHGQTIFHHPVQPHTPFTLQIGDPNIIAEEIGITTVADFRRRDMAAGGQGAPLVPAFHNFIFRSSEEDRFILNLGGIANITYLPIDPNAPVLGFDIGPANLLLDQWIKKHQNQPFDKGGKWATQAPFDPKLLQQLLSDAYFQSKPPKSTGPEYFNLKWLTSQLLLFNRYLPPNVVQATLCELTATSVSLAIQQLNSKKGSVFLCGGGSKNTHLVERLKALCQNHLFYLSDEKGIPAKWMEAIAFAWLAKQALEGKASNLPSVTGARNPTILGGIYQKNS